MKKKTSFFQNTTVRIISSSHNDIAFLDSPMVTIQFRNDHIILEALQRMEEDPNFYHSMECSLYMKDFLILHPEMKELLGEKLKNGQFGCGATYTQCYEGSETSEGLARQYYLGKRWMEKTFPGCNIRTTWNVDVPGRTMQSAQIMQKSHVDYLFASRMDAGFFRWFSPDGSSVEGYSTGHYHNNSFNAIIGLTYNVYDESSHTGSTQKISIDTGKGHKELAEYMDAVANNYYKKRNIPPFFGFLSIRDYDYPLNLKPVFQTLEQDKNYDFPKFAYASATSFMDDAKRILDKDEYWNIYKGERPNLWLYHEPTHAEAMSANRRGMQLLEEVEQLSVLGLFYDVKYPQEEINACWEKLLYLDHGWGGCNGHITDETYLQTSLKGMEQASSLVKQQATELAKKIRVTHKGNSIVIYNPSLLGKTDEVYLQINWEKLGTMKPVIVDPEGNEIPYQIIDEPAPYTLQIVFIAQIPALGYVRYEIVSRNAAPSKQLAEVSEIDNSVTIKNKFYQVVIKKGGITSLIDNETEENLVPKENPLALFEVFVLDSIGNGSGEFSEIQQASQPFGINPEKYWLGSGYTESAGRVNIQWHIPTHEGMNQPHGEVATIVVGKARFPHFVLVEKITVFNTIKKIKVDVDIEAFDGTMYKEIRMNIPLPQSYRSQYYEVPFGILHIGKNEIQGPIGTKMFVEDGKTIIYPTDCREIHPREIQSWIGASKENGSILVSCPDTPTCDFHQNTPDYQPILLASRHSCFSAGNPYMQIGNHHYSFAYTNQKGNYEDAINVIREEKHPFVPICLYQEEQHEGISERIHGITIQGNVFTSIVKKAEDTDELIIRVYEPFGKKASFSINFSEVISTIRKTDLLEYGGVREKGSSFQDTIEPYAIETYAIGLNNPNKG